MAPDDHNSPDALRAPNSLAARDIAHFVHPYTDLNAHKAAGPLIVTGGEGVRVRDDEGNEYIEGLAGLWCAALGFNEKRLIEAAVTQMRALPFYHSFTHKSHPAGIELAEKLAAIAPPTGDKPPLSKVFFAGSGSEANDTAIKMIWYYQNSRGRPGKKKILSRVNAYHGVTIASASLTGLPANHREFDLPIDRILHVDCPHHYRHAEPGESEEEFAARLARNLEARIQEEGPETIAAFFAEPIMGAGGVIVPPPTYFERIQPILREHDILFVADEVICGFHRTGNPWGSQTLNIQPDILTSAKALSSAYLPISAVLVTDEFFEGCAAASERIGVFGHGFTYSAHPVCAAVALEAIRIYEEADIGGHVRAVAPRMQARVKALADHPLVGHARGVGLIGAVELAENKAAGTPFDPRRKVGILAMKHAQANGLLVRALAGDVVAFCPPLIIEEAEIDDMFDRMERALDATAADLAA